VKKINDKLYENLMSGDIPDVKNLVGQEDIILLKRRAQTLTSNKALPPIVTHNMVDGDKDGSPPPPQVQNNSKKKMQTS